VQTRICVLNFFFVSVDIRFVYATSVDFGNVKLPVETACKRNDIVNVETATDIPPLTQS